MLSIQPLTSASPWIPVIPHAFSSLFSLLLPLHPFFLPFLPLGALLVMVHSTLVFQHQRGKAGSPGHGSCAQPSHSICAFPCGGRHHWVKVRAHGCVACVCTCACMNGGTHLFRVRLQISSGPSGRISDLLAVLLQITVITMPRIHMLLVLLNISGPL